MKRREAIQQIALASTALALWPACNTTQVPDYAKIPLDRRKWKTFQEFAEAVLPVDHEIYPTLEPRANYILTILNDCTPQEEVDTFNLGLEKFKTYLDENVNRTMSKSSEEELDDLFDYLQNSKSLDPALHHFYYTTRSLAKQHFTTSEKYMTDQLEYKFLPGNYLGCVNI
jgi:hypothetical protein